MGEGRADRIEHGGAAGRGGGKEFRQPDTAAGGPAKVGRRDDTRREGEAARLRRFHDLGVEAGSQAEAGAGGDGRTERLRRQDRAGADIELRPPLCHHGDDLGSRLGPERDLGDRQAAFQQSVGQGKGVAGAFDRDHRHDAERGRLFERRAHVRTSCVA